MKDWDEFLGCFAETVKQRRLELGLSQEKLAELTGFQRTYIADVERSARAITLKTAWKLSACLKINLSVLIERAESLESHE